MKCIACQQRKGKRFCPAKNSTICAQCCGQKRVVEIACPSDCVYLTQGQSYQVIKKFTAQLTREEDPLRRRKLYETNSRHARLLHRLEGEIVQFAKDLRTLTDDQIEQAVRLLQETYRTERKGIIFEHTSSDPVVQALLKHLRQFLEKERRADVQGKETSLELGDILDCLEVVEENIRFHLDPSSARKSYLRFIQRNHPEESAPSSGLIVPGA